ncbi:unnamed protein product [Phytophthora fragariaefolia]|uniref:Unnamed protein product n=1 Tax=Phytophthora fragariaefolia TaxID=1490495 RepID=A0A9W6XG40_9STRA|nr:unnamed protein product [Phytophthora fragariaefolia]
MRGPLSRGVLCKSVRVPVPAARGAPGDGQLAAAAEVVRLIYGAEIDAAAAREEAAAARAGAAVTAQAENAAQSAAQAVVDHDDAMETTPSRRSATPSTSGHRGSSGKQLARRSARRSLDVMSDALARTPPRGRRTTATELIAASPQFADIIVNTAYPAESSDADVEKWHFPRLALTDPDHAIGS